jgi:hypothetical protein
VKFVINCKLNILIIYMKKFLNSDWQEQCNFVEMQCKKMKYSANFIDYKIQPFLAENNTKKPNIYKWQKWLAFLVDLLLKLFRICDLLSVLTHLTT